VAFHAPELLSADERGLFEGWLQERWSAPDTPETGWTTRDRARTALDEMRVDDGIDQAVVTEIATYLQSFDPPDFQL